MKNPIIAFIGGGNMARSLIGGMLADGYPATQIWVADPDPQQCAALKRHWPAVNTTQDNLQAVDTAQVVVFAVKPQVLKAVATSLQDAVQNHQPLIISIAAGIRTVDLERWLGGNAAIVRCMPNTPALVQSAATGLFANNQVDSEQHDIAESVLRAVGLTVWVEDEVLLDAVTAISGSGPAYFFQLMEMLEQSGIKLGLPAETARLLSVQTAFGAAKLALESDEDAASLRQRVTSKGGTTERALNTLEDGNIRQLYEQALTAAAARAAELADQYGADSQ